MGEESLGVSRERVRLCVPGPGAGRQPVVALLRHESSRDQTAFPETVVRRGYQQGSVPGGNRGVRQI